MAARRPAGEGTVRRRADGRWEARVTLPTGERRSVYARTRALAERGRRDLLSAAAAGTVQTPGQLGKLWAALGRRAGLPPRPLRTLRHGAASRLLAAGVPVPVVQAMLGHATPTMTLSVYARLPSDELRRWVARLDRGDAGEGVNGGVKPGRDGRS